MINVLKVKVNAIKINISKQHKGKSKTQVPTVSADTVHLHYRRIGLQMTFSLHEWTYRLIDDVIYRGVLQSVTKFSPTNVRNKRRHTNTVTRLIIYFD